MDREVKWQLAKTLGISTSPCRLKSKWQKPSGKTYSVCRMATWPVQIRLKEKKIMNIFYETNLAPKMIPAIVPLTYQAIGMLNQKIGEANRVSKQNKALNDIEIPLWKRYSLSITEASKYYGIGEKRLRQMACENAGADFLLEVGSHIRIKRVLFEKYLDVATVV